MMDRFEAMTVLLAVVEAGSLSGGGRKLGMPLSTVSRKISELEGHLNARLLARTSRQLGLTEAGQSYVVACKRILEDLSGAERAAAGEYSQPSGDLVITAPVVFGRLHVLPVVTAFLADYPDIDINLILSDRIVHLLDDHVDMALRIGALPDSSFKAMRLGAVRHVVCASPGYLQRQGTPQTPDDLTRHACITFTNTGAPDRWTFRLQGGDHTVRVRARLTVNTANAAIDAAIAGLGVTRVLSYQVAIPLRQAQLVTLLQDLQTPELPVSIVFAAQGPVPLKLRTFLDFAAPRLKMALQQAPQ